MLRCLIRAYQRWISPTLHAIAGPGAGCRYDPTCSQYFIDALDTHGFFKGSWLGIRRIARCHPWGGHGHDPVPGRKIPAPPSTPTNPSTPSAPAS